MAMTATDWPTTRSPATSCTTAASRASRTRFWANQTAHYADRQPPSSSGKTATRRRSDRVAGRPSPAPSAGPHHDRRPGRPVGRSDRPAFPAIASRGGPVGASRSRPRCRPRVITCRPTPPWTGGVGVTEPVAPSAPAQPGSQAATALSPPSSRCLTGTRRSRDHTLAHL